MPRADTRPTLIVYLFLCVAVVVPLLWILSPFALPIGMGVILAVICHPVYARLVARRIPRPVASLIVTGVLVVLVMGPITWFLVTVFQEAADLVSRLATDFVGIDAVIDRAVASPVLRRFIEDPVELRQQIQSGIVLLAKWASNITLSVITRTPDYLLQGAVCALTLYFLVLDGGGVFVWVGEKLPLPEALRQHLGAAFKSAATAVVLSSMSAAAAQTTFVLIAFLTLGTPLPFLAAFATFILAWVPLVGIGPVVLAGAIWHWSQHEIGHAIGMLAFGAGAGLVDNFVRPWVLKGRNAMHPLLSLLSIFGGIALMGVLGVFVGPVVAAMAVAVLETWPSVAKHCDIAIAENERLPEVDLPPQEPPVPVPPGH